MHISELGGGMAPTFVCDRMQSWFRKSALCPYRRMRTSPTRPPNQRPPLTHRFDVIDGNWAPFMVFVFMVRGRAPPNRNVKKRPRRMEFQSINAPTSFKFNSPFSDLKSSSGNGNFRADDPMGLLSTPAIIWTRNIWPIGFYKNSTRLK